MPSKPWYLSKTIIAALVGFAASLANFLHVSLADLVPQLTDDIGSLVNDGFALAGVIGTIVGRFKAEQALTLTKNQAAANNAGPFSPGPLRMAFAMMFTFLAFGLTGCGTDSVGTTTSSAGAAIAPAPLTPAQLTTVGYEAENFLQQFNTGVSAETPSVDDFLTATHNTKDAQTVALYASLASAVASTASSGLKAALPPQQVQAATNVTLAPAAIPPLVSNVVATTPAP